MNRTLNDIYNNLKLGLNSRIYVNRQYNTLCSKDINNEITIFLTIADVYSRAKVVIGKGKSLNSAISSAIKIYLSNKPIDLKINGIMLDIVTKITPEFKKGSSIEKLKISLDNKSEGMAFDPFLNLSLLPNEITSYQIIQKKRIATDNLKNATSNHLPANKELVEEFLNKDEISLYKFKTISYFINDNQIIEDTTDHDQFSELDKKELWYAINLTKNYYFKNVVENNGKFIYSYLPTTNKREESYNILRHAGTIYSMVETYELISDETLLEEIRRAISYLETCIKEVSVNGKKTKVVVERNVNKLGGNALAIVALAKYTQVTEDTKYITLMSKLAEWIMEIQNDNGEFSIHKQEYSTGNLYDFISRFYPGEAILALVRLYQITKDENLLDVAENAAHFLIKIRDKNENLKTITPDHWLLYGLNDLYRERPNDIYLEHSFFMTEAMMRKQLNQNNTKIKEYIGGYRTRPRRAPGLTTAACWNEGLGAAYRLAKYVDQHTIAEKIKKTLHEGIKFQLQAQLRPETVVYLENKPLCLGGMPKSLTNFELRIDYTQHNISSFISYYNILTL